MARLREYWQRLHRNDRPWGLWLLMIFGGLLAALMCLALVTAPLNLGVGSYAVGGDDVPGREFVAEMGILSWIGFVVLMAAFCILAYGIYQEKPWVRPWLVGWVVTFVPAFHELATRSSGTFPLVEAMLYAGLLGGGLYLYLYRKTTVVTYYAALREARQGSDTAGVSSEHDRPGVT